MRNAQKDLELCDKATQGPWWVDSNGDVIQTKHITRDVWFIPKTQEDVKFIVESRDALPYWIKRAVEAERLLKATYPHLHEIYDDENQIRMAIGKFLGGDEG